jgi:predicted RNA-binding Zn-ribbon protein involved in translation (DUF1610 family)
MSKKELDATLEQEIGNLGADNSSETQEPGLGKLKHKAAYGQREDLSEDDRRSLDDFLNKTRKMKEDKESVEISSGWIPIDRELMGVRSQFYPAGWEFFVKPATLGAIKNWTAINEEKPDQVNKVFNEIIKQCVKIDTHSPQGAGWAQINSWDRFWFILKVREYTFFSGESKIEFDDECTECGQELTFKLTADGLHYEFPDETVVNDYWTGKSWDIDPTEYDVDHEPITLYTPKLGKDEMIIEWETGKARANQKIDETFIEFLVWMIEKPSKDVQMFDRQVQKIYKEYKSWSVEMFDFMREVIKNITINPSENLIARCPHCGQETISGVKFPNGIQTLFGCGKSRKKFGTK